MILKNTNRSNLHRRSLCRYFSSVYSAEYCPPSCTIPPTPRPHNPPKAFHLICNCSCLLDDKFTDRYLFGKNSAFRVTGPC